MIIRVHVTTTNLDMTGCARRAGFAYLVDEHIAAELAAVGAIERRLEAARPDEADEVAALEAALFLAPTPEPEPAA